MGRFNNRSLFLIEFLDLKEQRILTGYRKLVHLEILSLILASISGLLMWINLGYPNWTYYAFIIAPFLTFAEFYHYRDFQERRIQIKNEISSNIL